MNDAIQHLYTIKPPLYGEQIDLFLQYHAENFGVSSSFPPTMYNHYRNVNPRTTNYIEGRHGRWKKRATKPHDDIYACIDMFKSIWISNKENRFIVKLSLLRCMNTYNKIKV